MEKPVEPYLWFYCDSVWFYWSQIYGVWINDTLLCHVYLMIASLESKVFEWIILGMYEWIFECILLEIAQCSWIQVFEWIILGIEEHLNDVTRNWSNWSIPSNIIQISKNPQKHWMVMSFWYNLWLSWYDYKH